MEKSNETFIDKISNHINNKIDSFKTNIISNFIQKLNENGYQIVYTKDDNKRAKSIEHILEEFYYLSNDVNLLDDLKREYKNKSSIIYFFNEEKKLIVENINRNKFEQITEYLMSDNEEYNLTLLKSYIKYVALDNVYDTYLGAFSQIKFREGRSVFNTDKDINIKRDKYFSFSLITTEDASIKEIENPLIISNTWNSNRISGRNGLNTYNSIFKQGFKQDNYNHYGSYIKDIDTLFINNGNHSNAIGSMMNVPIRYEINSNIKSLKFNDAFYRANFYYDKMILDDKEYFFSDWRKSAILKLSQQILNKK